MSEETKKDTNDNNEKTPGASTTETAAATKPANKNTRGSKSQASSPASKKTESAPKEKKTEPAAKASNKAPEPKEEVIPSAEEALCKELETFPDLTKNLMKDMERYLVKMSPSKSRGTKDHADAQYTIVSIIEMVLKTKKDKNKVKAIIRTLVHYFQCAEKEGITKQDVLLKSLGTVNVSRSRLILISDILQLLAMAGSPEKLSTVDKAGIEKFFTRFSSPNKSLIVESFAEVLLK